MKQKEAREKATQAFALVCGKKYKNLIASRIENAEYQFYFSISNAQKYLSELEKIDTTHFSRNQQTKFKKMKAFYIRKIWLEQQIKQAIIQKKKLEIYYKIAEKLPKTLKELLEKNVKYSYDIVDIIIGEYLGSSSPVDVFSDRNTKLLKQLPEGNLLRKQIIEGRKQFLEEVLGLTGAVQADGSIKRGYQKYIPSNDVITLIERGKAFGYQEVENQYYERYLNFSNPQKAPKEQVVTMMKKGEIATIPDIEDFSKEPKATLVYCIQGEAGVNDYLFLHELFHRIGITDRIMSGIDCVIQIVGLESKHNPWKRKFEILNETITDIYAIKALKMLREQGISLVEPVEYQNEERIMSMNTPKELKELVMPFVDRYQEILTAAILEGGSARKKLLEQIGIKNWEKMNDIVDHLYAIMQKGVIKQIEDGEENQTTKIYKKLVEELEETYAKMEEHGMQCFSDKSL